LKIATFNVNGITSRLPRLLDWLARETPDVVCLQELKAADKALPAAALHNAGYGAVWHGPLSWNGVAVLARGVDPVLRRRGLPSDPDDTHSRYDLVVSSIYLPNGNPQPGPRFEYKLAWFERLIAHTQHLFAARLPAMLAGDFNVVPTDDDIYDPRSWRKDALLQPDESAPASTARRCRTSRSVSGNCRRRRRLSTTIQARPRAAACTGFGRSWSPKSSSPAGPTSDCSVRPPSSLCVRTRAPAPCSAKLPSCPRRAL
jgi:endonuclease/exonuclease/phosphatase family metal-dependent hydrolase